MAKYFSQMVVRPDIPKTAMTELELRVLSLVFRKEMVGEDIYFCAPHGPKDVVPLAVADAVALLAADEGISSMLADIVREELAELDPDEAEFDLDVQIIGYEAIFQDVGKRSALDYIEIESAWSCSKMLSDGFGGGATLITATDINDWSTTIFLRQAIAKLPIGVSPG